MPMKKLPTLLLAVTFLAGCCENSPSSESSQSQKGVSLPNGMISVKWDSSIGGFSNTVLDDIYIIPHAGEAKEEDSIPQIMLQPWRISVATGEIACEVATTERCAIYHISYPEGETAFLTFDVDHGTHGMAKRNHIEACGASSLRGYRQTDDIFHSHTYFFFAEIDAPILNSSIDMDGVSLSFQLKGGSNVRIKMGLSAVSYDGARNNLKRELRTWRLNTIAKRAESTWKRSSSRESGLLESDANGDWCDEYQEIHNSSYPVYLNYSQSLQTIEK